jgi:hypothetical protein
MTGQAALAGAMLIAPVGFSAVEMVGYRRGRFGRVFWELPLDAKLDHVGRHNGAWWLMTLPWFPILAVTTAGLAAQHRAQTGATPDWAEAAWQVGYVLERVWIVLANLAAVGYGVAVLRTELLPGWLGWAAIVIGLGVSTVVLLTWDGFPELALPVYLTLGVALLVT